MDDHLQQSGALRKESQESVIVIGGGGHARVVISILKKLKRYRILGYTDCEDHGLALGVPFLGADRELAAITARHGRLAAALGVGQVGLGEARYELWKRSQIEFLAFPSIISPDAIINEGVSMGEAAVVMDGVVINIGSHIGLGTIVNTNSTIEHDVVLHDWVHVAPGVTLSGGVTVGQFSMIGAGSSVIEGVQIESRCFVGAGAVVVRDLKEPGLYAGCPARRIG
jgi:sugar O-acyltransferase (sialic acid O-acetyltransferase NeuD family)